MNEKITQPRLVSQLAEISGISKRQAEEFLKAFVSTLADEISDLNSVKIKGFGSFKVSRMGARKSVNVSTGEAVEIPPHYKVSFIPDKAVAAAVNAPFDMFETVELEDDVDEEEMQALGEGSDMEVVIETPRPVEIEETRVEIEDTSLSYQEVTVETEEVHNEKVRKFETIDSPVPESSPDEDTEILPPEIISSETQQEEREKSKELGEKLEEDFGPIVPVEPFGPIEPDDSSVRPKPGKSSHKEAIEPDETEIQLRKHSFNKGLIAGIVATFIIMILGFGALYWLMMSKIDAMWEKENQNRQEEEVVMITQTLPEMESVSEPEETGSLNDAEQVEKVRPETERGEKKETEEKKREEAAKEEKSDNKESVAATPASDKPKYDTITKSRFLTTMAKEYYGNYHLWPYIYKENEKILGHPDRIKPGTRIVIPDLAKYHVSASNPNDIKKAKEMGVQIYNRYK